MSICNLTCVYEFVASTKIGKCVVCYSTTMQIAGFYSVGDRRMNGHRIPVGLYRRGTKQVLEEKCVP